MRLTNIQLIHAAHHAARYLPKASAELVRELTTRLDVALVAQRETAKLRDALAAENADLKKYICDECYVENVRTGHYACAGHGIPSTPATDFFLAEVRAQGVDMAIKAAMPEVASEFQRETFEQCVSATVRYPQSDLAGKVEMVSWLELFAAQLRQEAAQ